MCVLMSSALILANGRGVGAAEGVAWLLLYASPFILIAAAVLFRSRVTLLRLENRTSALNGYDVSCLAALIVVGVGLFVWAFNSGNWSRREIILTGAFATVLLITTGVPGLRRVVARMFDKINALSLRGQFWVAMTLIPAVAIYLPVIARTQGRTFDAVIHDELSYLLMARIFASGRLWMPALPASLQDAFESFYIFTTPVYGSMYFPGAGLIYAVPLAIGLPAWVGAATIAGVFAAMLFRVLGKLFTPACGLASVCGLLGVTQFRWFSTHIMSHVPLAAAVVLAYWAYFRWDETRTRRWLAAFAAFGAYAAITRPYDAVLFLLPPAVVVVVKLIRTGPRPAVVGLALVAICVAPFLALQLTINRAYTGDVFQTPFERYFDQYMPNAGFGFHQVDPNVRPDTRLRQKLEFYDTFAADQMQFHGIDDVMGTAFWSRRLMYCFSGTYGYPFALLLLPLGLAAAFRSRAWVVAVGVPVFLFGYTPYVHFLAWYSTGAIAAMFVCYWASIQPLAWLTGVSVKTMQNAFVAATFALGLVGQPFWYGRTHDQIIFDSPIVKTINQVLETRVKTPALVLFVYGGAHAYVSQHEPVYNLETAWPDDASVIRVHALGTEQDVRVLRYYQKLNGSRHIYLFDRRSMTLASYGTIDEFLRRLDAAPSTRPGGASTPDPNRSKQP